MTDLRNAARAMRAHPGFAAAAVVMLALGIGINVAVFSITNSVLFKGFRLVEDNDRILYIGTQKDGRGCCASYPDFVDWRDQATSFVDMGVVADLAITFRDRTGSPETYTATQISANGFQVLGQRPVIGRDFLPADEAAGAARVAILSYGFWERRYAKDPGVVGQVVSINGEPATVIGVMGQGFAFPQNQAMWVPVVRTADLQNRDVRNLWFAFGRMAAGVTVASATAELETIGGRLARAYPQTNDGWIPRPRTFSEFFVGRNAATTYLALSGAVAFVLLIACANIANLTLARTLGRSREMSVRMALGAGRWRVARQLVVESLMLSALGGVLGWWIAAWGVRAYELMANPPTRAWSDHLLDYTMDYRVLAYLVAMSIGTGLLSALIPALRLARVDVNAGLKEGSRGVAPGGRGRRVSSLLVAVEMALAIVLLAGAGVMIRSFLNIHTADIGVTTADTVTMFINLPVERYVSEAGQAAFYDRLGARLRALPGVESVTMATGIPAGGARTLPYELAGRPAADAGLSPPVATLTIGPAYFRTLRATVLSGREFDDFDSALSLPVAIVNERFARVHWPGESPLGRRLRLLDGRTESPWLTVVGVTSNIVQDVTRQKLDPVVYVPYGQRPAKDMSVIVNTGIAAGSFGNTVRREIEFLDPDLPIGLGPFTLDERLAGMGNYWNIGSDAALLLIFAAMALLLASLGLYAVVAQAVTQRTQEIGIRMAIGATARDVLQLVCMQGMLPLVSGLAIGLAASLGVNRILESQLVEVSPSDPATLVVASCLLVLCGAVGCVLPACRAMNVDPLVALKND
jgi:predicted permease